MRLLEDTLAEEILSGRLGDGDTATVDIDENGKVTIQSRQRKELLSQVSE
jgi:ATP-dependent Clp protease ATP-binding subunit ClpC